MNLIANSGIQYFTTSLKVNLNDNFKMYFHEWFDIKDSQLKLEIAHFFSSDDIWVKKLSLRDFGYLTDGKANASWDIIKTEVSPIPITTEYPEQSGCFKVSINKCDLSKFENQWLPFPFFRINNQDKSEFGPVNWCRFKMIPKETVDSVKNYDIVLAFDTHTLYEDEGFEDKDFEAPVFASVYEKSKEYALCKNEFMLIDFCSKHFNCEWVDEYILKLIHNVNNINQLKGIPKFRYLANYIYLIHYIQHCNNLDEPILPKITLCSDRNVTWSNVDLVIDIGNSRTCAVLFDEGDFTKVRPLELQDFSSPVKDGKLNKHEQSFDMRLAFRKADFGKFGIENSNQFVFPSLIRLGEEANQLIHKATNLNTGIEKITTFSSPKRYLWNNKPQKTEWEFVQLEDEHSGAIWIDGISQQLNPDGSLNPDGNGGQVASYSRKSLMTFAFLEILAQAKMQINSYTYRNEIGNESSPRKINRIIITCPTAMSKIEQIALRQCAEEASIILNRFFNGKYYAANNNADYSQVKIIPSVKNISNREERMEWTYDEATCSQFVFLYAEISRRYLNNCKEYFDLYGKVRNDLGDYHKKSLTIGSVDIGAGTTDLMICAYKQDNTGQCTLTPVPLFWESFYFAGDDLLKEFVRQIVIEGPYSAIQKKLEQLGRDNEVAALNFDFFGENHVAQTFQDRQLRNDFNLQISVPIANLFLELLKQGVENKEMTFKDIFSDNMPTQRVLEHFKKHFGFDFESLQWKYDIKTATSIVEKTFDSLLGKIATIFAYYGCDFVLLSGRPTSLKPIESLFLKYYPVSPNRLVTLNNYRVGRWYPFQDGNGYFKNQKSIVAIGAMIGNISSTKGSLTGFSLDLNILKDKLLPTTEYFALLNGQTMEFGTSFISPNVNYATVEVSTLPVRIGCRQLDTHSYPSRPLYVLDFNLEKIEERIKGKIGEEENIMIIKTAVENEITRIRRLMPLYVTVERENYIDDKEKLTLSSVEDRNHDELPLNYFNLQIQSLSESESFWLDSGEFILNITHR
jgi:hypothetical protein